MNFFVHVFDVCVSIFHYFDQASVESNQFHHANLLSYIDFALMLYDMFCFGLIIQMANSVAAEAEKIASKIHRITLSGPISDKLQQFVSKI